MPQLAMTCNKSTTSINIYVVEITFCYVYALSAVFFSYFSAHNVKYGVKTLNIKVQINT